MHLAFVYSNYIPMFCSLVSRVKVIIFSGKKYGACIHVNLIILQFTEKKQSVDTQRNCLREVIPVCVNSPHYLFDTEILI